MKPWKQHPLKGLSMTLYPIKKGNEMKELIDCKDLLDNERVKAAAKGLGVDFTVRRWNMTGHLVPRNQRLEVVAFAMRDACIVAGLPFVAQLLALCGTDFPATQYDFDWVIQKSDPRHWIRAATLAWEAQK